MKLCTWVMPDNFSLENLSGYDGLSGISVEFLRFHTMDPGDKVADRGAVLNDSHIYCMGKRYFGGVVYTRANAEYLRQNVSECYVTLSGRVETGVHAMLAAGRMAQDRAIAAAVNFVSKIGFHGIDLNVEGLAAFEPADVPKYVAWLKRLGIALHKKNLKFRFTALAEGAYVSKPWSNDQLIPIMDHIDEIAPMGYDYMFDYGAVQVSPQDFVKASVEKLITEGWPREKIILGVANYGYIAKHSNPWSVRIIYTEEFNRLSQGHDVTMAGAEKYVDMGEEYMYFCGPESMEEKRAYAQRWDLGGCVYVGCAKRWIMV